MQLRLAWAMHLGLVVSGLLFSRQAGAQEYPPAGGASAAPRADCRPPCREGFLCQAGQCVSACNPPCATDQVCVEGRRCEPLGAGSAVPGGIYEPPPPPPPSKQFADRAHSLFGFHLGFPGRYQLNRVRGDLDSTYGGNIRTDFPVARYLLLGPLLQVGLWRPDTQKSYNYYFDLALAVRGRIPIALGQHTNAQIWAGVPIGVTLNFLGGVNDSRVSGAGLGWNVGVLFGGAIHFKNDFGLFAELGWLQHKMSHNVDESSSLDFTLSQWILNVGFAFKS